jgi:hypothetical protein
VNEKLLLSGEEGRQREDNADAGEKKKILRKRTALPFGPDLEHRYG